MNIRKYLIGCTGLLGLTFAATLGLSSAQADSPGGLTLIVAYGAGGGTDTTARLLAKDMETITGTKVTVRNVTGGGGWNGWGTIAAGKTDGHTIGYIKFRKTTSSSDPARQNCKIIFSFIYP